jgi:hypothetical protein
VCAASLVAKFPKSWVFESSPSNAKASASTASVKRGPMNILPFQLNVPPPLPLVPPAPAKEPPDPFSPDVPV